MRGQVSLVWLLIAQALPRPLPGEILLSPVRGAAGSPGRGRRPGEERSWWDPGLVPGASEPSEMVFSPGGARFAGVGTPQGWHRCANAERTRGAAGRRSRGSAGLRFQPRGCGVPHALLPGRVASPLFHCCPLLWASWAARLSPGWVFCAIGTWRKAAPCLCTRCTKV